MNTLELVKRAYDANAFTTGQTEAGYVNPEYWDRAVMDHVRANLVALQFGVDKSSQLVDGDALNVTVLGEPTSAATTAESDAAAISAWQPTTVVLTPSESTKAHQLTDKEARRAFLDVMGSMVESIGYALAKKADADTISELQTNAGNAVFANAKAASTDLASSDTLDHDDIINAMELNAIDQHSRHIALIANPQQVADLSRDTNFLTADKFGADMAANRNGFVGSVLGIPVFMTTQIPVVSDSSEAILISSTDCFAYVMKSTGGIKTEYHALERYTDVVGAIDFDVAVTRANAICTIESWTSA